MWIVIAVGGLILAVGNSVVTSRLWRSPIYERSQKIAQTVLVWLLPGSAVVVNWLLQEPSKKALAADPTVSNRATTDYAYTGVNLHGDPPGGGHG
jgi:hypothetical protein